LEGYFMGDVRLTAAGIARELFVKGLGGPATALRQVRYFTNEGLLKPEGLVNTGSGRKRMYRPGAVVEAAFFLRLYDLKMTVGMMKQIREALVKDLIARHKTNDIVQACARLDRPTVFVVVPQHNRSLTSVRLLEFDVGVKTIKEETDAVMIQLKRFL
jgi:hypothetical protein